jgi:hypothetical protein
MADAGGGWSITAVASDNAGLGPAGSCYALTIDQPGGSRNRYRIELNRADGAVQYIAALGLGTDPLASSPYLLAGNNLDDVASPAAALANLGGMSQAQADGLMVADQTTPLAQLEYFDQWSQVIAGQTDDPLAAFGLTFGSQTYQNVIYGDPVTGPAFWFGYNPHLLSAMEGSASHGAIGISCFADAADTNNGAGGHGPEFNVAFRSMDGEHTTNAIGLVAVDDNTNAVALAFRCGTGSPPGGYITVYQPTTFRPSWHFSSRETTNGSSRRPVT